MAFMLAGLFLLSLISGMLGIGAAFAAVPFLSLFLDDLVNEIQPLCLLLNGITALFAAFGFARGGYVDWRMAGRLALVMAIFAPLGSYLAELVPAMFVWYSYLMAAAFLVYKLFSPAKAHSEMRDKARAAAIVAAPIAIFSGFLGVGPGFILMPALVILGFAPKLAAGINAIAVTLPSFSALLPHMDTARLTPSLTIAALITGAAASFLGARLSSLYLPEARIKQLFGLLLIALTLYRIALML